MLMSESSSGGTGWRERHIQRANSASAGKTERSAAVTSLAGCGPGGPISWRRMATMTPTKVIVKSITPVQRNTCTCERNKSAITIATGKRRFHVGWTSIR